MPRRKFRFVRILMLAGASFALLAAGPGQSAKDRAPALSPIDPQRVQDQDLMTWDDYRPIPGKNWADPALKPERGFKLARRGDRFSGTSPSSSPCPRVRIPSAIPRSIRSPGKRSRSSTPIST